MKKSTTLFLSLSIGLISFSQNQGIKSNVYQFNTIDKYPEQGLQPVNNSQINSNDRAGEYYEEDFDSYTDLASSPWTVVTAYGPVDWKITNTGHANNSGNTFTIPPLNSSTPSKWVMVDSDEDGVGPEGSNPENTSLISPVIDLQTAGAPTNIKLVWDQYFAEWNNDSCYVGVSTDNGASWNEVEVNAGAGRSGRPNPEEMFVNISTWAAVNPTNVQIRFRWGGAWDYGWQIDNIRIVDLPNNDLNAATSFRSDWSQDLLQYSKVPIDQVTPITLGCQVKNVGFNDQTNIGINYRIFDASSNVVASGTSTNSIASLLAGPSGTQDTIWMNTGFTPTALGQYTIEMVVFGDDVDDFTTNDTIIDSYFEVTEEVFAVDYGVSLSDFSNWANNTNSAGSIGNLFEISADDELGAVIIGISDDPAQIGLIVNAQVYKYDAGIQDFSYIDQSADYFVTANDLGQNIELLANFSGEIPVNAGDLLLVLASHYGGDPSVGVRMAGKVQQGNVQGFSTADGRVSLLDPSAPVVRMRMQSFLSVDEKSQNDGFTIYPNPTLKGSELTISYFSESSESSDLTIIDMMGKTVGYQKIISNTGANKINIKTDNLSKGIYFIKTTLNGKGVTKKVIVQ